MARQVSNVLRYLKAAAIKGLVFKETKGAIPDDCFTASNGLLNEFRCLRPNIKDAFTILDIV